MLKLTKEIMISASQTDAHACLTPAGTFTLLQDIAAEHAERMGVGFHDLLVKSNAFWVIARTLVKFIKPPRIYQPVTLTTWPSKPTGAICIRNYEMTAQDGSTLVLGKNEWVIMDAATHRIRRLTDTCYPADEEYSDRLALDMPFYRFEAQPEGAQYIYTHRVRLSDTDSVRHTNNVSYIRMFLDSFSGEFFDENVIEEMEIKYSHESREGDDIAIYRMPTEDGYLLYGKKGDEGLIVSARIKTALCK